MLWWVIGLFLALAAILGSLSGDLLEIAQSSREFLKLQAQSDLAQAVQQYRRETGKFPVSGPALAATPGFSPLRSWISDNNGGLYHSGSRDLAEVAVSNALVDAQWMYDRAAVYAVQDATVSAAFYLGGTQNTCAPQAGSTDFATSVSWCGSKKSTWSAYEARGAYLTELVQGRTAEIRTVGKFLAFYNAGQFFPDPGSETSLTKLAGGPATAAGCSGVYTWSGIPFGCEDLFSRWGTPISYLYKNDRNFALVTTSNVKANDGSNIVVATAIKL